jgi:ribonuclease G
MIVIDVNSGRYARSKEQEQNSLKTDLEASREIVRQMRLRDIGGIIVVDFIDLEEEKNRKKIFDELKKEFRKDRAKVSILPMSDFGLVQITRQRVRQNIMQTMKDVCPECMGTGVTTKESHLLYDLESWLTKFTKRSKEKKLVIKCHPATAQKIRESKVKSFFGIKIKYFIKYLLRVRIEEDDSIKSGIFKFFSTKTGEELT